MKIKQAPTAQAPTASDHERKSSIQPSKLCDLEKQFQEAQKEHPDLWLERFVDSAYLIRGAGRERFRSLAACAARVAGHLDSADPCQSWIEILLKYLLEQDHPEYLKLRPAAVYVNREETSAPSPDASDSPWDKPGAIMGNNYTIHQLFRASADCCLWLMCQAGDVGSNIEARPGERSGRRTYSAGIQNTTPIGQRYEWEDIEISFISDERAQQKIGKERKTENYAEMGFEDKRSGKPNQAWGLLRALGRAGGTIPNSARSGKEFVLMVKRIERLRRTLREHFGISSDPISLDAAKGYCCRFQVRCAPSFET